MRRRSWIPLTITLALLAALGIAFYLRAKAPPEAARLLPESDAIVYVHLKTLRNATHFDATPVNRSPALQRFVDATGIVPERDLDAIAVGLHRVPTPTPHRAHEPVAELFTSEVLRGRFDGDRLTKFLASAATSTESYAGRTIYAIPFSDDDPAKPGAPSTPLTLRVTQLDYETIGASDMPTAEQMHSMIDRSRASATSSPGSSLLANRYKEVPQLPLPPVAWGIGHLGLPFSGSSFDPAHPNAITVLGLQLPLPTDTDLVASIRFSVSGAAHLRVEEIAPNPDTAESTAAALANLLNLLRGLSTDPAAAPTPSSTAMTEVLASATLDHHADRVTLDATATAEQLKSLAAAHNPLAAASDAPAATPNAPPASHP